MEMSEAVNVEPASTQSHALGNESRIGGYREIWGVVKRNERDFWTRIGVAFENRDGSWNMRFEYTPTRAETTIQLREPKEREAVSDS